MKILVTGAGGSGGSYLVEHLLKTQSTSQISALLRNDTGNHPVLEPLRSKINIAACDLSIYEQVHATLEAIRPDQIYHIASNAKVGDSFAQPLPCFNNNVAVTANLLEALRQLDLKPKTLICSTSEVYGQVRSEEVPIKETNAIRPASPYAVSKVTQDLLAQVYCKAYQIPVVITRMFTYINPRRSDLFATAFALQVAEIECGQREVLRHGNLDSVRTFIDIRDAMLAYELAMELGVPGEIYNLGGRSTFKVGELLEVLKKKATCAIPSEVDPKLLRPVDVTLQIPDTSKFEALTGWRPQTPWEESIDHLLAECRQRVSRTVCHK